MIVGMKTGTFNTPPSRNYIIISINWFKKEGLGDFGSRLAPNASCLKKCSSYLKTNGLECHKNHPTLSPNYPFFFFLRFFIAKYFCLSEISFFSPPNTSSIESIGVQYDYHIVSFIVFSSFRYCTFLVEA